MAGQGPDETLLKAEGPGESSGGNPTHCRGQSLQGGHGNSKGVLVLLKNGEKRKGLVKDVCLNI